LLLREANTTLDDVNKGVTRAYRALETVPVQPLTVGV
jgi:hypothetical protein